MSKKAGGKEEEVDGARVADGDGAEKEEEKDLTKKEDTWDSLVSVKIADLGNACWVVSVFRCKIEI